MRHCRQSSDRVIQKNGWRFSESEQTGAMPGKANEKKCIETAKSASISHILNFLLVVKSPLSRSVRLTSMNEA